MKLSKEELDYLQITQEELDDTIKDLTITFDEWKENRIKFLNMTESERDGLKRNCYIKTYGRDIRKEIDELVTKVKQITTQT